MTLNEYQKQAMTTCMQSSNNFSYMMLNLVGEVGEFASKVAKAIRKEELDINANDIDMTYTLPEDHELREDYLRYDHDGNDDKCQQIVDEIQRQECEHDAEFKQELAKEAGDILWQLSGLCSVMGWSLEDIAQQNLDKLASRKERNVIDGNGDNR